MRNIFKRKKTLPEKQVETIIEGTNTDSNGAEVYHIGSSTIRYNKFDMTNIYIIRK